VKVVGAAQINDQRQTIPYLSAVNGLPNTQYADALVGITPMA
jgi:hypothetical protein